MAITKQEVVQELKEAHQQFSDAARRIFALMMKVQNMAQSELGQIAGDLSSVVVTDAGQAALAAAASSANAATASATLPLVMPPQLGTLDREGKTTQPEIFIPQMNTQDAIDAGKNERLAMALNSAKSVFKEALAARGLPAELADKVDAVSIEDINRHRAATGLPAFGAAEAGVVIDSSRAPVMPSEATAAQPLMPTEEPKIDEKEMMLACFIGVGSAFAQYLNADAMFHGKGDIKPGFHPEGAKDPIKRYSQDARWLDEATLRHWPTGFYTDRDSKMMQLLVNTDQAAFLVGALPSEVSPVDIFIYGSKQGYRPVQAFEASELRLLHAKLDDTFAALTKKK